MAIGDIGACQAHRAERSSVLRMVIPAALHGTSVDQSNEIARADREMSRGPLSKHISSEFHLPMLRIG